MVSPELSALLYLLDDTDMEVRKQVQARIIAMGTDVLEILKSKLDEPLSENLDNIFIINELIDKIEFEDLKKEIKAWLANPEDLLYGMWLGSKFSGSEVEYKELNQQLERFKLEVWLELRYDLTALEKVKILNFVLFNRFGFKGDEKNFYSPENCYLHKVLKNKKGNPLSLSIVYALVAQKLYIPIYGVNLPQHFVLAYLDISDLPSPRADSKGLSSVAPTDAQTLFYINAYNKGAVFGRNQIDFYLSDIKKELLPLYYNPCSNRIILERFFRNLLNAYTVNKNSFKQKQIQEILEIFNL
jgi:hypothetical protein